MGHDVVFRKQAGKSLLQDWFAVKAVGIYHNHHQTLGVIYHPDIDCDDVDYY